MSKTFRFIIPDNGDEIVARWTTPQDFAIDKLQVGFCSKGLHRYKYVLCITQWGIDRQLDIVVAHCKKCGDTCAYKIVTMDDLKTDVGSGVELETAPAV